VHGDTPNGDRTAGPEGNAEMSDDRLEALAEELRRLSPADRAKLAAMLDSGHADD
jgi:hypothetical protein